MDRLCRYVPTEKPNHVIFRDHCTPFLLERLVLHCRLVRFQLSLEFIFDIGRKVVVLLEEALDCPGSFLCVLDAPLLCPVF